MAGLSSIENDAAQVAAWLCTTEAVRARCHAILDLALQGGLSHFEVDLKALPFAANYVAEVIRENYPDLKIPYHARWRHFSVGGRDRWRLLARTLNHLSISEIARIRVDLCVTSVLLDAGAGTDWRYREHDSGAIFSRSEGLAVASLDAFCAGLFSSAIGDPFRADAAGLRAITPKRISEAFQAGPTNPLTGVEGRSRLMQSLGEALAARPDIFGTEARLGNLYDYLSQQAENQKLSALVLFAGIMQAFGSIWPARLAIYGVNLGDTWQHGAIKTADLSTGLVPFHKLSQWLTYSLIEIFEEAGIAITDLDQLTGLPEYRNGGLFLDLGVLKLRDPAIAAEALAPGHEAIVEWRALTLAMLDKIAEPVRKVLGKSAAELPLARILEGGTWAAGRKIAREKRSDGGPPLLVESDGTVF